MKVEIKVPSMGESISEAIIANVIKASGSSVNMDDEILELETDKVNQVLFAPQSGVITLNVKVGDHVKIGQVLGSIDTGAKATKEPEAKPKETPKPEPEIKTEEEPKPEPKTAPIVEKEAKPEEVRYQKEAFVRDLKGEESTKEESGKGMGKGTGKGELRETRRKMSNIRKVIASRMVEVKNSTAMLTTFNEVDMSQVIKLRETYQEEFQKVHGVKLGFMSFFVTACITALKQFPDINSYIDGDEIVHREFYDIGIAVGTDRGVIVPVLRDCDRFSLADIEQNIGNFAKKAREGSISADDLQGGSFTITNGGVYGSMLSTPIISPKQSAILGLHKITKRAVVVDDQVVIRPIMYLALSYDHRIVDGKEAVSFLAHIKNSIENPGEILLNL